MPGIGNKTEVARIERELNKVLIPPFDKWWETPIPAFEGGTPSQILEYGKFESLLEYVKTYQQG